jgi:hypothetical protein
MRGYMVSAGKLRKLVQGTAATEAMKLWVLEVADTLTVNGEIDSLLLGMALGYGPCDDPDFQAATAPIRDLNKLPFVRTPHGRIS